MPQAFVTIDPELLELCTTHTLVTPNERLAREYHLAYGHAQLRTGKKAWPTLRCSSLQRLLRAEYGRLQDLDITCPRLLPRHELIGLAQATAPSDSGALIDTFLQAWQTVVRYEIDLDDEDFRHARARLFRLWCQDMRERLPTDVVLEEELGKHLAAADQTPDRPLILIDFDVLTPAEQRFCERAAAAYGVQRYDSLDRTLWPYGAARPPQHDDELAAPTLYKAASLRAEVAAAAAWARARKMEAPDSTIGIVVPTLAQHYDLVLRQSAAILDPLAGSPTTAFDIAAGTRLSDQPVWQHARRLLRCSYSETDADEINALANSPFLEMKYLSGVCAEWPRRLRKTLRLPQLQDWLNSESFDALAERLLTLPGRADMATWSEIFAELLELAGWPQTATLGSAQFQAIQAIERTLGQQERVPTRIDAATALQQLELRLGGQIFAPERPHADIQILGALETTGLQFDALWICGLDENSFPARNLASPFLPRKVAQRYGVPRSSQREELEFASTLLHRWRRSCRSDTVHVSYSGQGEEGEQAASPLLAAWADTADAVTEYAHPYAGRQDIELDKLFDHKAPQASAAGTSGGTGLLTDQAGCPFKAFAKYRLRLRAPTEPGNFPDAMLRGVLLHDALFNLVRNNDTQARLAALSTQQVRAYAEAAVAKSSLPLAPDFASNETERLTNLLLEWLVIEQAREPFEVVALEEMFELDLAGLRLRVRVDRLDRIDGAELVLDYKTGKVALRGLLESPPEDAQLPAYSLISERIDGVYYAQIRDGDTRLFGAASPDAQIAQARLAKVSDDWSRQRQTWHDDLNGIARDFLEGQAAVAPRGRACDYCHLPGLCRIGDEHG